jgi:hypothetical protein
MRKGDEHRISRERRWGGGKAVKRVKKTGRWRVLSIG